MEVIPSSEFETRVLKSEKLVLVDFFATWCRPCKMLAPILEQVAGETEACEIVKMDVDESMDVAKKYGIMSVPTMILFKNGEEINRATGLRRKSQILEMIDAGIR